jgi:oxygen-independent coproporphyrinogen III oxidase
MSVEKKSFSLYVHIPFCFSKCDYCDFFSIPCGENKIPDLYFEALINEAKIRVEKENITSWSSIYFGGGTPALMTPLQIKKYIPQIIGEMGFKHSAKEFTFEMNPEAVSEEKINVLKEVGVNRLSLGIQSMNDNALCSVNRHCSRKNIFDAMELIKKNWQGHLSLDVIAGLPDQSDDEFYKSLKEVVAFEVDHISLYTLTLEKNTPLYKKMNRGLSFDFDAADRQWLLGAEFLEKNGFFQYEVSNFAKKGFESFHNMSYWKQKNYIGLGAGAHSSIYYFDTFAGRRINNINDIKLYTDFYTGTDKLSLEKKIPYETEQLSLETLEFEFLMMGLRCLSGISSLEYKKRFCKMKNYVELGKRLGEKNGLWKKEMDNKNAEVIFVSEKEKIYRLTKKGLLFLNRILEELM